MPISVFYLVDRSEDFQACCCSKISKLALTEELSLGNKIKLAPKSFFIGVKNSSAHDGDSTCIPEKSISTFSFLSFGNKYARALKYASLPPGREVKTVPNFFNSIFIIKMSEGNK